MFFLRAALIRPGSEGSFLCCPRWASLAPPSLRRDECFLGRGAALIRPEPACGRLWFGPDSCRRSASSFGLVGPRAQASTAACPPGRFQPACRPVAFLLHVPSLCLPSAARAPCWAGQARMGGRAPPASLSRPPFPPSSLPFRSTCPRGPRSLWALTRSGRRQRRHWWRRSSSRCAPFFLCGSSPSGQSVLHIATWKMVGEALKLKVRQGFLPLFILLED